MSIENEPSGLRFTRDGLKPWLFSAAIALFILAFVIFGAGISDSDF